MSQQAPNNNDVEWLLGIIFIVVFILLYIFKEEVGLFFMKVRYWQAYFIPDKFSHPIFDWIATTSPKDVAMSDIAGSGNLVGQFWRWPIMLILGGLGYRLYVKKASVRKKYAQRHTRDSLMKQEANEWNVIKPIVGMNLTNIALDHPIEGMRQIPREWAKRNKILFKYANHSQLLADNTKECVVSDDGVDIIVLDTLKSALKSQIGRRWEGFDKLKRHEKSLMIAFCAQIRGDTASAQFIINELALQFCVARDQKDMGLIYSASAEQIADAVLNTPLKGDSEEAKFDRLALEKIKQAGLSHAYVRPLLMTLILMARRNGKLPPNWFRWLKSTDRITWYSLCDLGLDEEDMPSSIDAAGVRSHWLWERRSRSALVELYIDQAIPGFISEINTRMENPNDDEDSLDALAF